MLNDHMHGEGPSVAAMPFTARKIIRCCGIHEADGKLIYVYVGLVYADEVELGDRDLIGI